MHDCWNEIDREILGALERRSQASPQDIARDLGISEGEATALICMLARAGQVRIRLVERVVSNVVPYPAVA